MQETAAFSQHFCQHMFKSEMRTFIFSLFLPVAVGQFCLVWVMSNLTVEKQCNISIESTIFGSGNAV